MQKMEQCKLEMKTLKDAEAKKISNNFKQTEYGESGRKI